MLQQVTRLPFLIAGLISASIFIVTVFASDELQPQAEPEIPVEEVSTSTSEAIIDSFSTTTASTTVATSTTASTTEISPGQNLEVVVTTPQPISLDIADSPIEISDDEWRPRTPLDCFSNDAKSLFDSPSECLRFVRSNF